MMHTMRVLTAYLCVSVCSEQMCDPHINQLEQQYLFALICIYVASHYLFVALIHAHRMVTLIGLKWTMTGQQQQQYSTEID